MYLFTVYVTDRISKTTACVGDLLTRTEAGECKRVLEKFNACDVTIVAAKFCRTKQETEDAFV